MVARRFTKLRDIETVSNTVTAQEAAKLEAFLKKKLNPGMVVQRRQRADECAEIHIGDECLGVVQKIVDEGETSYAFEITILDIDLEEV
ncbi:DUF3126 family protein [Hyphobacterium sp. CCMP332]|uniref:DUF3126 family protein n=1 Tax=Hyphobacterium sp. CCMP332 TaxID=2749086 RepID=UPI00164F9E37|nr:DUF3126 family protein [Hyphobacterium sp. CCMP332]QNL18441.1 DUF3126 family protein [Hyphobacterium sp. CCMP332]